MSNPTAIVVDDDLNIGSIFKTALELSGFSVEHIQDSRRAFERIRAVQPILVTLDMQMPIVSGAELLRAIRADEQLVGTKVMLVTANSRVTQDEAVNQLADVILIKPVTLAQIRDLATRLAGME